MIEHTYRVLEYYRLLDILSRYASCALGRSNCLALKPSNDPRTVDIELRLVSELRLLLKVKGFFFFSGVEEITPILKRSLPEGSCLEPGELLSILQVLEACRQSKRYIEANRSLCPGIYELVRDMPDCKPLMQALKGAVSSNGAIKDSASPALGRIREKKVRLRLNLQKRLEGIQRSAGLKGEGHDNLVTIRDGRYVIPLRTDHRSRVKGIIHQYSQTRTTCFVEPLEVIQDNNRMAEVAQEEEEEEYRILTDLTTMVKGLAGDLEYCQSLVARLDGLHARARFSEDLSCVMPELAEDQGIELKGAMNPILLALTLEKRKSDQSSGLPVPVDFRLDHNGNVLIISGPNRGGKTVALKTLGLISLMTQAGIHIPADEGSYLPVFTQIMADIGDEQDIQSGISTFSAHAAHLKYILENADERSLVIIDEPGMGTDPNEGAALAMAALDCLSGRGAWVAVSTHLNRLKAYGLTNTQTVNASVEFDADRDCPTFRLRYGSPGVSHGLDIARDTGVPIGILEGARKYLDKDEVQLSRLIEKLNRLSLETESEKKEAEDVKREYHSAAQRIRERLIELEEEKESLMEAKRIEAEAAIREAREGFKDAINLLKSKSRTSQAQAVEIYKDATHYLLAHFEKCADEGDSDGSRGLSAGERVYHRRLGQEGVIKSVDLSAGRAQVMIGNVNASCEIKDLELRQGTRGPARYKGPGTVSWGSGRPPRREVNVIGYRVDDAIPLIDKSIDRALVEGDLTLRIIHGFGTGRLRDAIRAHLREVPFVKRIGSEDLRSGGDAITIVEL
jgi:DNA mismatch repair protein MutS2